VFTVYDVFRSSSGVVFGCDGGVVFGILKGLSSKFEVLSSRFEVSRSGGRDLSPYRGEGGRKNFGLDGRRK
jgi:hypothetical protein